MRFVKTFVLRLFVDSNAPGRVCGSARSLDELESHPFKSVDELVEVLRQSIRQGLMPGSSGPPDSPTRK